MHELINPTGRFRLPQSKARGEGNIEEREAGNFASAAGKFQKKELCCERDRHVADPPLSALLQSCSSLLMGTLVQCPFECEVRPICGGSDSRYKLLFQDFSVDPSEATRIPWGGDTRSKGRACSILWLDGPTDKQKTFTNPTACVRAINEWHNADRTKSLKTKKEETNGWNQILYRNPKTQKEERLVNIRNSGRLFNQNKVQWPIPVKQESRSSLVAANGSVGDDVSGPPAAVPDSETKPVVAISSSSSCSNSASAGSDRVVHRGHVAYAPFSTTTLYPAAAQAADYVASQSEGGSGPSSSSWGMRQGASVPDTATGNASRGGGHDWYWIVPQKLGRGDYFE